MWSSRSLERVLSLSGLDWRESMRFGEKRMGVSLEDIREGSRGEGQWLYFGGIPGENMLCL